MGYWIVAEIKEIVWSGLFCGPKNAMNATDNAEFPNANGEMCQKR